MKYNYQRGMKLSKLSLGTVQLGVDYGISNKNGKPDEKTGFQILKQACDNGINVFDTAAAYGDSEVVIGNFLANYNGQMPTIVTKFMINADNTKPVQSGEVEKILRASVERSLKNLRINCIPLLMLHRENEMFDYGDVLPNMLKKLKTEGLVERIGVSLFSGQHIDTIVNDDLYEAVQLPLNIMDTAIMKQGGIEKLKNADVVVFVRSVFLQGLFFRNSDDLPTGVLQKAAEPLRRIKQLAEKEGISIAQLAFSFIRDLDGVSSLVLGSENPEQILQNIDLVNSPELSKNARNKIMSMFDDIDPRVIMPWTWNN